MAMRRQLCAVLAFSLALAVCGPRCLAEAASTANSTAPQERPAKGPTFCFQGAAPDRQEAARFAERTQRDASRAACARAGDRDDAVFVVGLAIAVVVLIAAGLYVATQAV
jgi:hypothetical protein